MLDLSRLNPEQREAVTAPDGPVLVVAGPGSGKTAVIAARVAYLIDSGRAPPSEILVLTFTNKAGRELVRRLASVLGEEAEQVWAGTFHAFGLGLLRRWADRLGYDPDHLSVYADEEDRRAALDQALVDCGRDPKQEPREAILAAISRWKGQLQAPDDVSDRHPEAAEVYEAYAEVLRRRNAVDFDDMLLLAVRLLEHHEDVAETVRGTARHVLVDELQDVSYAQHRLLALLVEPHRNLFAVGDPLQSLFSWRGSNVRYLLDFGREHPDAQVVALARNYRSTGAVLAVANALSALLAYGQRNLWTANPPGMPVVLRPCRDAGDEAAFVVGEVQRLLDEGTVASAADCAVLYRTNLQAREMELACLAAGVPYSVRGSGDFIARREVRDLLAYLRLLHNPRDTSALVRIVNVPPRRLPVLEKWLRSGEERTIGALERDFPCGLEGKTAEALRGFLDLIARLRSLAADLAPATLIDAVLDLTGYRAWLAEREGGQARLANLAALRSLAGRLGPGELGVFLDEVSLATDLETGNDDGLVLSTIHAAKGLEWPVVFVAGLEEGLLPHARSLAEGGEEAVEEELRLCYVAVTRAIERLYLTYARSRSLAGRRLRAEPSRFLQGIADGLQKAA